MHETKIHLHLCNILDPTQEIFKLQCTYSVHGKKHIAKLVVMRTMHVNLKATMGFLPSTHRGQSWYPVIHAPLI